MRNTLFIKIYLTVLASLILVAVLGGIAVRIGQDRDAAGWTERRDAIISAMLPADADPATLALIVRRLSEAFDADIAVRDASGRIVARAGAPLPPDAFDPQRRLRREDRGRDIVVALPGNRVAAARLRAPPGPIGRAPLAYLAVIAAAIGLAAYPVTRRLTRRLETVRSGVERWGAGALETRVPETGRDEIASVAASFNRAAAQIESLLESHRSLLANASHELRSPLTRLRMAIDLGGAAPSPETRAEIVRNLAEIDQLVDEILLASRLDHVKAVDRHERVDLLALAAEEAARYGADVSGVAVQVDGDATLLRRLVRNLLQNAANHARPPIAVAVSRTGDRVEFSVRDHGDGIAASDRERVFEPFFRPKGRSEAAGGWGLGLSLVRQIAAHHGGTVAVESPKDGGARFVVVLPAARHTEA